MARPEKVAEVQAITRSLEAAQSIVMADFTGLTVLQMTDFRAQCRAKNIECRVVKNRLAMIAADAAELSFLKDHLQGPTALIFGPDSQTEPAKVVVDFAKANEKLAVKGGIVDGQFLDPEQVVADLVYHPLRTAWLRAADDLGARTVDGLGMLLHQTNRTGS